MRTDRQVRLSFFERCADCSLAVGARRPVLPLGRTLARVPHRNSAVNQKNQLIATARTRVAVLEDRAKGGVCPTCQQALPPPGPETEAELETATAALGALLAETGGGQLDLDLERRVGALIDETTIPKYVDLYRQLSRVRMMQYERGRRQAEIRDQMQGHSAATVRTVVERARALESGISVLRTAETKNARRVGAFVEVPVCVAARRPTRFGVAAPRYPKSRRATARMPPSWRVCCSARGDHQVRGSGRPSEIPSSTHRGGQTLLLI